MPSDALTLHLQLTVADLARFQYFHRLRRGWAVIALAAVVLVLLLQVLLLGQFSDESGPLLANVAPLLIPLGLFLLVSLLAPYRYARRAIESQFYLYEPATLTFTPETLSSSAANSSWCLSWRVIREICETKSLFVLYHGPNLAVVLPKSAFPGPAALEAWRALARQAIAPRTLSAPSGIGRWC